MDEAVDFRPHIVILGAGATGRGQLGELAFRSGWRITFIERSQGLVQLLRESRFYCVRLATSNPLEIIVNDFEIVHTDESDRTSQAICDADIVATAVIPTNLPTTTKTLRQGLISRYQQKIRKPLNVIACENMERSSTTLRKMIFDGAGWDRSGIEPGFFEWIEEHIGFPDAMVARAVPVPEPDPLVLIAEATQEWSVDELGVKFPIPHLEGMTLAKNQEAALERKLYIKNTGHFSIGLLGFRKGYQLMDVAARDPEIFSQVDEITRESAEAIRLKHDFEPQALEEYRSTFLEAMKSPLLPDDIRRVIREPIRKISREERLTGPAMLACEKGIEPVALARMIALTLTTPIPGDVQSEELVERLERDGFSQILIDVCGIPQDHRLHGMVLDSLTPG